MSGFRAGASGEWRANRKVVKRLGGISPERQMPPFARQDFKAWFRERGPVNPHGEPVVLFPDTFNNYLHPEPMKATVDALEDAGYRVVVPMEHLCCGRPLYDYGMLDTAERLLRETLQAFAAMEPVDGDSVVSVDGIRVALDDMAASKLDGAVITYDAGEDGYLLDHPDAVSAVWCG